MKIGGVGRGPLCITGDVLADVAIEEALRHSVTIGIPCIRVRVAEELEALHCRLVLLLLGRQVLQVRVEGESCG